MRQFVFGIARAIPGLVNAQKNKLIKIRTISPKHVAQLPYEHYWNGEFDFSAVDILGIMATDGFLLCREKKTGRLHRVCPVAFNDWQLEQNGCRKKVNSRWEYAPLPHTEYARKAIAALRALPQIFTDEVQS